MQTNTKEEGNDEIGDGNLRHVLNRHDKIGEAGQH